jgi:hypothetical protein
VPARSAATAITIAAVAGVAGASTAGAATLLLDQPCYLEGATVVAGGQGWDAGKTVQIRDDAGSRFYQSADTNPMGAFLTNFRAPLLPTIKPAVQSFVATATEIGNPGLTAQVPFSVTNARVDADLGGKPTQLTRFSISGFPPKRIVYGHWVYKRRARADVAMGRVPAPCGVVTRRVRRIPARVHSGTWRIQFDTHRRYSARSKPRQILKLTVFRTFR